MKEHLRKYFPERFSPENDATSLTRKALSLVEEVKTNKERASCERKVMSVMQRSNELKLLVGAMKKYGCNFRLSRHVSCELCDGCHGGFDPDTKQIVICQNSGSSERRIMATMMHEMIHMFDYCRAEFDFDNLDHVACSEIRAANITYCGVMDRMFFGGPLLNNIKKSHRECVQDVAFRSVKAYSPETEDSKIWKIIDRVFPGCYNDLEPFGRRYHKGSDDLKQSYRERYYYGYF